MKVNKDILLLAALIAVVAMVLIIGWDIPGSTVLPWGMTMG